MPRSLSRSLPARLYLRDAIQGMVPQTFVRVLWQHLQARGVAPQEVIPRRWQPDDAPTFGRLPAEDYCRMLIKAAERLDDPLLGLHLGQSLRPAHLGALGYVLLTCETLGAALTRILRYHRLMQDINPVEHVVSREHMELRWGTAQGKPGALFDEAGITGIVQFGRDLCDRHLVVSELDFVNPPPPDIRPYTAYFGCHVRFGMPVTRLVIPLSVLAAPLRQADPTLLRLMEAQVDVAMAELPEASDLAEATRRMVAHLAPHGTPALEQVAQALRLSPRVFYRRLAEQGLNFRELREVALRQLAELHLRDARLTLAEVGALLGYTEQSAFSRAFKRWTGSAPLRWRQLQQGQRLKLL